MSVRETACHRCPRQPKVIPGDSSVACQLGLGIAPEILNPVDVLASTPREALAMVNPVVPRALRDPAIIARQLIRGERRARGYLLAHHRAQRLPSPIGDGAGIEAREKGAGVFSPKPGSRDRHPWITPLPIRAPLPPTPSEAGPLDKPGAASVKKRLPTPFLDPAGAARRPCHWMPASSSASVVGGALASRRLPISNNTARARRRSSRR